MSAELEKLAEQFRKQGYTKEADVLKAQATLFRKSGIPEEFPVLGEVQGRKLKRVLVEILSAEPYERGKGILTPHLAEKLNHVGQRFEDDTPLGELKVKPVGNYNEFERSGEGNSSNGRHYRINVFVAGTFNRGLQLLLNKGIGTVGEVRYRSVDEIMALIPTQRGTQLASSNTINFIKSAFARPS